MTICGNLWNNLSGFIVYPGADGIFLKLKWVLLTATLVRRESSSFHPRSDMF
jgi:hypothetical protein